MKMRFGVGMERSESVNEVGERVRLAEDCGFELVTLVDEPFLARDIFTALAMVAVNTDRVLIRHGVVDPLTYCSHSARQLRLHPERALGWPRVPGPGSGRTGR